MNPYTPERRLTRRDMLAHLAALALSLTGLARRAGAQPPGARAPRWDDRFELAVDFEIAAPDGGRRYQRPYVAVWVEDAAGAPVRTLSLWVQNSGRGRRYLRELRRWFRGAQDARAGGDLVDTISSATRMPGKYTVLWNGRDDAGAPVEQGQYFVCIEASREHGTYQLMRQDYAFATRPFRAELPGNTEIGGATVEYRRRK